MRRTRDWMRGKRCLVLDVGMPIGVLLALFIACPNMCGCATAKGTLTASWTTDDFDPKVNPLSRGGWEVFKFLGDGTFIRSNSALTLGGEEFTSYARGSYTLD